MSDLLNHIAMKSNVETTIYKAKNSAIRYVELTFCASPAGVSECACTVKILDKIRTGGTVLAWVAGTLIDT